jgi:hypothetical protein
VRQRSSRWECLSRRQRYLRCQTRHPRAIPTAGGGGVDEDERPLPSRRPPQEGGEGGITRAARRCCLRPWS